MSEEIEEVPEMMDADEDRTRRLSLFHSELRKLINKLSLENESNTPDFILAEHLMSCLLTFEKTMRYRSGYKEKALEELEE